jgi:heme/copper-type cytochrome/quinol oxidase subunit 1
MKKIFFRVENLLLVVSLLLVFIGNIVKSNTALDIHLHDTYFVTSHASLFISFFPFVCVQYGFHLLLRWTGKRSAAFSNTHVYGSIFLQILFFILSLCAGNYHLSSGKHDDFASADNLSFYSTLNSLLALCLVLYLLLQLAFIIYFIVRMLKKAQ